MTITTKLYTKFFGEAVGEDAYGNRYFRSKKTKGEKEKRWVVYKGLAEPSKVPPQWHGWLHYTHDTPPAGKTQPGHEWEKEHLPNLTGTKAAYVPPGHASKGGRRDSTTSDYQAWRP